MMSKRTVVSAVFAICVIIVFFIVFLLHTGEAKRGPPPVAQMVRIAGIEYRAPNTYSTEGIVEAWNMTGIRGPSMLWRKKIYSTIKLPMSLEETDAQWNFITNITVGPNSNELTVVNEKGDYFILNVDSTKVRRK